MCGIAGVVSAKPIEGHILSALRESLRHRGPDDEGTFVNADRTAALVHTRLSILDLSPAGHQPMSSEDGTVWITYNGEIYNYRQLKKQLLAKGHRFRSQTDTEVILRLYEEEGEALLQRLTGMFAFAIYDQRRKRLFLARDRLGIKPLYYAQWNGALLFASEIKAILATELIPRQVNWQAVFDYFTFQFIPHPETAFQNLKALAPAHRLVIDLASGRQILERYWVPWNALQDGPPRKRSYGEQREQVRELLTKVLQDHLVSDVPLGVFLSGGIDSTLLAALMARHLKKKVKTFTVGFRGAGFHPHDDLMYARMASRELGTLHHELWVDLDDPEALLGMLRHVDQPFGNPTLHLQYLIAQATRQEVTVALSGVGGDELFGGYPRYRLFPLAPFLGHLPSGLGQLSLSLLDLVREDTWVPLLRRAKRLLKGVGCDFAEQYLRWSYSLTEPEKRALLNSSLFSTENRRPAIRIIQKILAQVPGGVDRYGKVLYVEMETLLAGNLLEYTDKATMAVALETRVPYLDHRLVELSFQIPFHDKIRPTQSKHILIDAFREVLPRRIVRAPKRGFNPPFDRWMDRVLDRAWDQFLTPRQVREDGIFSWEALETLRRAYRAGRRNVSSELLSILFFTAWYRRSIQGAPAALEGENRLYRRTAAVLR